MPNIISVDYDLISKGQNYPRIINAIRSIGPANETLASHWEIQTDWTVDQVYDFLLQHIDLNDKLNVDYVTVSKRSNVYTGLLANALLNIKPQPPAVNRLADLLKRS